MLQLGKVHRLVLADLARRAPLLPGKETLAFIDVDSQQKRVSAGRLDTEPVPVRVNELD